MCCHAFIKATPSITAAVSPTPIPLPSATLTCSAAVAHAHLKGQKLGPLGKALCAALCDDPITITCSITSMGVPTEFGVVPEPLKSAHYCSISGATAYTALLGLDSDAQAWSNDKLAEKLQHCDSYVSEYLEGMEESRYLLVEETLRLDHKQALQAAIIKMETVVGVLQDEPSASRNRGLDGNFGEVVSGLVCTMLSSTLADCACMLACMHACMHACTVLFDRPR